MPPSDGLPGYGAAASSAIPKYMQADYIAPVRSVGLDARTTLKATFWEATEAEVPQAGDPDFVSIALNTGRGRVWRNNERTPTEFGAIALQPFEGAKWRFEKDVRFIHLYVPFGVVRMVSESAFNRDLTHSDLNMMSATRDAHLCRAAASIQSSLVWVEPNNLILDSWALLLAETLVTRFSSGASGPRTAVGKIPFRGVARAIDAIEAGIGEDLSLSALADAAGISVYHFAHGFRDAVGVSPHAYVLSRRIARARAMLKQDFNLADVAVACGFSNQAHFTTAFRNSVGVTPGEYRRAIRL